MGTCTVMEESCRGCGVALLATEHGPCPTLIAGFLLRGVLLGRSARAHGSSVDNIGPIVHVLLFVDPRIAHHGHASCFGRAVELGGFLHVLLASNSLSIAVTGFDQSIGITPVASDLVAAKRKSFVLSCSPSIHVALPELVDCNGILCPVLLPLECVGRFPMLVVVFVFSNF